MTGMFVGYREADAKTWALFLASELDTAFGSGNVFLDKDSLHAGNWRDQIRDALAKCGVMLVVMGPRWISIADDQGRRRLDDPDDVHCYEIATALARGDVVVIPIRVDGATPPRREDLPLHIRALADQQGRELSDNTARRQADLGLLFDDIERATGLTARRRGHEGEARVRAVGGWIRSAVAQLGIAIAASVALLVVLDLGLGWSLDSGERSVLVFLVFAVTLVVGRRWRQREKKQHAQA
jgi:hypothetical protein